MKKSERKRILFIGNSYTHYNNLPGLLEYFVKSSRLGSLKTKMIAPGGATLKTHWNKGVALRAIRSGKWTHVVLQEQSMLGKSKFKNGIPQINNPKTFFNYARRFNAEIKKAGAKTVFFLTWARKNHPRSQQKLNNAYISIAKKLRAIIVPVGPAWQAVLKKDHELVLYQKDESHPSSMSSYLAACVFYATLFGHSPIGLPAQSFNNQSQRISKKPKIVKLSKKEAYLLQTTAWKIAESVSNKN